MSKAKTDYTDLHQGLMHECMSAMSSLNMTPLPIVGKEGEYLSEADTWAKHAYTHLEAIMEICRKIEIKKQEKKYSIW